MKITHEVLTTALRGLRLAKPRKATLPVLDCVLLSANDRTVALSITDLDQTLTYHGDLAEPSENQRRLVPLAVLQRVAKEMPRDAVLAFDQPGQMACAAGNVTTLVPFDAPTPAEYPNPVAVAGEEIELPPAALLALQEARLAASDNLTRRNICCVCLEATGVVATDGRQLFHANTLSLPLTGLKLLPAHKMLGFFDPAQPVRLRLSSGKDQRPFTLRQGPWTWQALLLDETYPHWRKVLPPADEAATEVTFSTEDVAHLRQIIGLIPRDPRQTPTLALVVRDLKLMAVTGQAGHAQIHALRPQTLNGLDTHAWFNADFLLRAFDYGFQSLRWRDAKSNLVARDAHREYLFMPLGVADDKLPAALRPPTPAAPEPKNPTHTATNHTATHPQPDEPMSKPTNTETATAPEPTESPDHGPASTATVRAADKLMSEWLEARESARLALERLDGIKASLKGVARDYRELEKEHEALKRSVRNLQKLEVRYRDYAVRTNILETGGWLGVFREKSIELFVLRQGSAEGWAPPDLGRCPPPLFPSLSVFAYFPVSSGRRVKGNQLASAIRLPSA